MFVSRFLSVMWRTCCANVRLIWQAKGGAVEQWSNFHVTYATPPQCKTPFPNYTIIYIVKQRVIYVVFVSVYLLHLLHLSPLIGAESA